LVPKNVGDDATVVPFAIVKCRDTWCPSTRQPQGPFGVGLPNTEKK
jgi:hypothetical protein